MRRRVVQSRSITDRRRASRVERLAELAEASRLERRPANRHDLTSLCAAPLPSGRGGATATSCGASRHRRGQTRRDRAQRSPRRRRARQRPVGAVVGRHPQRPLHGALGRHERARSSRRCTRLDALKGDIPTVVLQGGSPPRRRAARHLRPRIEARQRLRRRACSPSRPSSRWSARRPRADLQGVVLRRSAHAVHRSRTRANRHRYVRVHTAFLHPRRAVNANFTHPLMARAAAPVPASGRPQLHDAGNVVEPVPDRLEFEGRLGLPGGGRSFRKARDALQALSRTSPSNDWRGPDDADLEGGVLPFVGRDRARPHHLGDKGPARAERSWVSSPPLVGVPYCRRHSAVHRPRHPDRDGRTRGWRALPPP